MKSLFYLLLYLALFTFQKSYAQPVKYLRDQHIVNQQERMVFKQWDRKKFTPTKGFLGLNPNYWLTWAWHPSYPRTDLRPLRAAGPQSQRILLVAAMKNTAEAYEKHTDTLRNTALAALTGYVGAVSYADPLWQLYYQNEFRPLTEADDPLHGSSTEVQSYLSKLGVLDWYIEERTALAQRLNSARTVNMERGSRIMAYHYILQEYRQLIASWENKKQRAALYLAMNRANVHIKASSLHIITPPTKTDRQIADGILSKSKL